MKKIVIIDYSLGNLFSVNQALVNSGANVCISDKPTDLLEADAVVLPGVGAFNEAMGNLQKSKLDKAILDCIKQGKPFLGICLGMQLLFNNSEEFGSTNGLGIIDGTIKKFKSSGYQKILVPQVGWNNISAPKNMNWEKTILKGINENTYMYFVHSYYALPKNAENVLSETTYSDIKYCSAVIKDNVTATQFHPEKSGEEGLRIYTIWLNTI
jgi:glutamine amidotransferase